MVQGTRYKVKKLLIVMSVALLLPLTAYAGESGVAPNVISLPDGPGSVEGLGEEFENAGNAGTAGYGVGISVPEGSGGFKPSLKLIYSGGNGNSALGFGWSMPLPRIQRQTDKGLPRYDGSDTYIYQDGSVREELVPLADGTYRLKNEGAFIRAERDGAGWEVRTKSGVIYRLGQTYASRVHDDAGTKTFAWNITEAEDTNGNLISYEWFQDGGQAYINSITYNDYGTSVACSIGFTYATRMDALADYRATFPVITGRRLTDINVSRGGQTVRIYVLEYHKGASPLTRLASITMTGSDGVRSMPPLAFAYTQFAPADQQVIEMTNPPGLALADANNALVDLNGDSLPDFISTSSGDHRYYINDNGRKWSGQYAMAASPSYELSQDGVRLADITGDGISDFVVARGVTGNSFFAGTGDASWAASVPFDTNPVGFDPADDNTRFVDLNGDRLIDAIRTNLTSVSAWIHEGNGLYERIGSLPSIDDSEQILLSDAQVRLADFNGDGLLDVARLRSGSLVYWPSMGYGIFDDPVVMSGAPFVDDETRLDAVDLNGDGLTDIVYTGINYVGYWLNRGDASFDAEVDIAGTPSVDPLNTAVQFADMNGNGTTDIVWVDVSGGPAGSWQYLDPIGDQFAGLITSIDNGLGKVVSVTYESSTAHMIRSAQAGDPWTTVIPFSTQVISRITIDDGLGAVGAKTYAYRDGYYDGDEREFRGFAEVAVTEQGDDSIADLTAKRVFNVGIDSEALKGRLVSEQYSGANGAKLRKVDNDWSAAVLENGTDGRDVTFPSLDTTVTSHVEGGGSPIYTRTDYLYDDFGNAVDELKHGIVSTFGDDGSTPTGDDEIFIHRDFAINTTNWVVDRMSRERVRDGLGNRVADKLYYYDGAVFTGLANGQVDAGNLMREEHWLDTDSRFVPVKRMRRDAWGNVTAILDANGGRREIFYDSDAHTYPVRERIFTGTYALDFVADYDLVFGKVSSIVDPNGAETKYTYDALGRLASVTKPGDTQEFPTESYSYELGSPVSTIAISKRERSGQAGTLDGYRYVDGLGRTRAEVNEDDGGFVVTKAMQFNARGKESFFAEPFRCGDSCTTYGSELTSRSGTRVFYDALARPTQTINPDGTEKIVEYRPLEERLFDENDADGASPHYNTPTTKTYDGQGRLTLVAYREGTKTIATAFSYDAAARLTGIVDPAGNARSIVYDTMGRMVAQNDPNAGHRNYLYDDVGNLVAKIKPDGKQVKFLYETTTNRILAKNLVETPDDDTWEVKYHYDLPSSDWEHHGDYLKGKLAWIDDQAGAEYFGYDARGRVVAKRRVVDGQGFEFGYALDAMDRQTGITYPDATSVATTYDAGGMVKSVGDYLIDRSYNAAGQVESEILGGGMSRSYSYDERRRVTDIATMNAVGEVVQQFQYAFDSASNVKRIADLRTNLDPALDQTQSFDYDDLYRLTRADLSVGSASWTYDEVGNITGKSSTIDDARLNVPDIHYGENGAGPYAVTTHGDMTLTYDVNGNMISMPGQSLVYDAEDRLVTVTKDDGTSVAMVYDHEGQRKIKDNILYVAPEYEVRDGVHYKYIWADGKRIARVQTSGTVVALFSSPSLVRRGFSGGRGEGSVRVMGLSLPLEGGGSGWGWTPQRSDPLPMPLQFVFACLILLSYALSFRPKRSGVEESLAFAFARVAKPRSLRRISAYAMALVFMISTFGGATGCMGGGGDGSASLVAQEGTIYYISDHLGSSHLITDSLGNIVREESRYPYGMERTSSGEAAADYVYTGKEYDVETGLIYFGGRYYVPAIGRWLTPDPLFLEKEPEKTIEMPLSYNTYAYVRNNPMSLIDEKGYIDSGEFLLNQREHGEQYRINIAQGPKTELEAMFQKGMGLALGAMIVAPIAAPIYAAAAPVVSAAYMTGSIKVFGVVLECASLSTAMKIVDSVKGIVSGALPTTPEGMVSSAVSLYNINKDYKEVYGESIVDQLSVGYENMKSEWQQNLSESSLSVDLNLAPVGE